MFTVGMTSIVALILAGMFTFLKPVHDVNEALYNKKQILGALNSPLGINADALSNEEVAKYFDNVEQVVVNNKGEVIEGVKAEDVKMEKEEKKAEADRKYPVFIMDNDGKKYYILTVRGNGLWDKIWGWIALESDLNTVAGAAFGHKGETPGLGAEIKDNAGFKKQFTGEKLYNDAGEYVSVAVVKGGADPSNVHGVDAISGATVTCVGASDMIYKGIKFYEPYLKSIKK
ncbi:MAG: NADH:ubiquinone reductase (Na(+)-transporting) subunit C [Saprospiraceae bacterium]|nr:NADH:ubiquinone reductase (Na(+)-transporting) subunit C [Saprospiraceae bacterium]